MSSDTALDREDLAARLRFEMLLADLSSRFINLAAGEVDREIEDAQRRVCESLGLDMSSLWQSSPLDPGRATLSHMYRRQEGPPLPQPMDGEEYFPWSWSELRAGRVVRLPSLAGFPDDAARDRDVSAQFGIVASLGLPLATGGGSTFGVITFHTTAEQRHWPEEEIKRLQLVAEVFANALARKRVEESLRESEARLAAGVDLAGLGFYEVHLGAQVGYADDRLRAICGLPADDESRMGFFEFWVQHLHPDDEARVMELRRQLHEGEVERLSLEYRFLHPTRGQRWIHHLASVTRRDAAGRAVHTFGVLRDITERRQAEESLRESYAEIERLRDRLQAESDYLKAEIRVTHAHGDVVGGSAAIRAVLRQVEQVAEVDAAVLIQGETGTGKELVAQAIHRLSRRHDHVMVKVNCAALPSGLVESELFGREKGAFTGALTRQVGRFELADGSTIFLDEVGELSLEVQAKLLRVLEAGEFERLGSPRTLRVNVRLIAATNRNLVEEVRRGRFREDLFYRLNVFPIRVPPLRERVEDIPLLVWRFLEECSTRMGKKITQVPRRTMEALQRHPWPGNVRELRNVIEHGAIVTTGDTLRLPLLDAASPSAAMQTLAEAEREHILRTLERTAWHVKGPGGAAVALGLKPATLYSRMRKLGIEPKRRTEQGSA
jgi:formate hydrogenlyase transcriptional activator